jgi:drug/metabolite transporter (DMT)-like permease
MRTAFYTLFALVAFAFNSILCRMALRAGEIDTASFTVIRLASGAMVLAILLSAFSRKGNLLKTGHWLSALFLFAYAICFSFAYLGLTAGAGALILFGAVQLTMVGVALIRGEKPTAVELIGLVVAVGGLIYLVSPGLSSPPLYSSALMALAGIAWGAYTLRGKGSSDPLAETTGNFIRSVPMVILITIPFFAQIHATGRGALLAVLSGAVASGIGYSVWYAALRHLTSTRAAAFQLAVPVIAAVGGIVLLDEAASMRLWTSAAFILGGIGLVIIGRKS